MHNFRAAFFGFALTIALLPEPSIAQTTEEAKLANASAVFDAFTSDPATAIPTALLDQAHGIAIIPSVVRVGLIFGGRRGKGVIVVRAEDGTWTNPSFITLTGGSFGAQIGGESADVVLVFGRERSVRDINEGKFTVGGDASATAGPVGRNSTATRDMTFTAALYTYIRSRGLFAGATIDGSKISIDDDANRNFYPSGGASQPLTLATTAASASTRQFLATLNAAAAPASAPAPPAESETSGAGEGVIIYPLGGSSN